MTANSASCRVAPPLYARHLGSVAGVARLGGRLGAGEMRIKRGGQTERLYVDGGFVQVHANVVTVLTPRAIPADQIKPALAREALEKAQAAQKKAAGTEAQEAQVAAQQKARAQLRIASHVGNV